MQAKAILQEQEDIDHEYLSITGLPDFTKASAQLIFGKDSPAIKDNRCVDLSMLNVLLICVVYSVASVQTISGTGANHLAGLFLYKYYPPWSGKSGADKVVYLSNPTWGEYFPLVLTVSMLTVSYS